MKKKTARDKSTDDLSVSSHSIESIALSTARPAKTRSKRKAASTSTNNPSSTCSSAKKTRSESKYCVSFDEVKENLCIEL